MALLQATSSLFLDGNSATFVAAIMTWTILCFFGTRVNRNNMFPQPENSNFMQTLLLMICERAWALLKNIQQEIIASLETENLIIFGKAIAESDEKDNPYKDKMMELVNKLQFKTVNFYNAYLEQIKRVKSLHQKVVTDTIEFFSSFFYSFLFCVFVLFVDSVGNSNMQWLVNAVCLTTIVSCVYWIFIWGYYCWSIKKRVENTEVVKYEFKFWTCMIVFVFMIVVLWLVNLYELRTEAMNYVYVTGIFITGIVAMIKYIKREKCSFTHYFNLIHFFLVVFFVSGVCWLQSYVFKNSICFTAETTKILCVSFVVLSGLIFPLFVPVLRLQWEIFLTNKKLKKAKRDYIRETKKLKKDLNACFEELTKLKSLTSKTHP